MYGYSGKILHIDLTNRKTWAEKKPEEWYKIYIGGCLDGGPAAAGRTSRWAATRSRRATRSASPMGSLPERRCRWAASTGLASKSPLTGFIGDSLSGSWFSDRPQARRVGWHRHPRGQPGVGLTC